MDDIQLVNGKYYSLWQQFVDRKREWIGGELEDFGDSLDRAIGMESIKTEIVDIALIANGNDSAIFCIIGRDFTCSSDVQNFGIAQNSEKDWITFIGYCNHKWRIKIKEK